MDSYQKHVRNVEKHRDRIFEAAAWLWKHPETGYREWKTEAYLVSVFEDLGYTLTRAGNVPGFYTDLDTGRPGPTLLIMAEMDALNVPTHPAADPVTHAAHACGHCAQCAGLVGVAAALKEPGALDGMCGRIRLMAVPAEEVVEMEFREELRKKGTIRYLGGKAELISRGWMDDVDLDVLIHTASQKAGTASVDLGANGFVNEVFTFHGRAAHAAGRPHMGINALYAANAALSSINALRETFKEADHTRVHPIITAGGIAANVIPDRVVVETAVRGATQEAIETVAARVNRAVAGAALSLGAEVSIRMRPGYHPQHYTEQMRAVGLESVQKAIGEENAFLADGWGNASSDMGDMSTILPTTYMHVGGATGSGHGADYCVDDHESLCVNSAKILAVYAQLMLENDAAKAKQAIEAFTPLYPDTGAFCAAMDRQTRDWDAVQYHGDGTATVKYETN